MVVSSMNLPVSVQATNSQVKLSGVLHFASTSRGDVPYLTALNGNNYELLGVKLGYLEGTKLVVTGWLQAPEDSTRVFSPGLTFAGAITITDYQAHCEKHVS